MKNRMMLGTGFVALSLLTAPAHAQFDEWDANDDAAVTEDEWTSGWREAGMFDEWDRNDDGTLDVEEVTVKVYEFLDENDDDRVDENEFALAEEAGWVTPPRP